MLFAKLGRQKNFAKRWVPFEKLSEKQNTEPPDYIIRLVS